MEEMNQTPPEKPNNHLVMAIITTILCCLPLGIVSIVFASQVNSKYTIGDYEGAEKASKNAKLFWIIALVLGLVIIVGYAGFIFFYAGDEFMDAFNQELERQKALQGQ